jgi:predicted RNA-binding Zn-ribbon protein involved in translation (DUF1610 family)
VFGVIEMVQKQLVIGETYILRVPEDYPRYPCPRCGEVEYRDIEIEVKAIGQKKLYHHNRCGYQFMPMGVAWIVQDIKDGKHILAPIELIHENK